MPRSNRWRLVAPIILSLQLLACQQKTETPANIDQAMVEYTGQALQRVRLTAKRAEQLGIKTVPVREEKISGILRKVVPAAAVVYDKLGNTWTFKNPDSLVFIRERISIDHIEGDLAILADGPPVGATVVTTGATELLNDEFDKIGEGVVEGKAKGNDEGKESSGTATMLENGNIRVVHRATGATGLTASIVIEYKPNDEEYRKIIEQAEGLKVGETKSVPPLADK